MMYHKNRLIKAYERVGCQIKVSLCCFGECVCLLHIFARVSKCHHLVFISCESLSSTGQQQRCGGHWGHRV